MARKNITKDVWMARAKRAEARLATVEQAGKIAAKVAGKPKSRKARPAAPKTAHFSRGKKSLRGGPDLRDKVNGLMAGNCKQFKLASQDQRSRLNKLATANGAGFEFLPNDMTRLTQGTLKNGSLNQKASTWAGVGLLIDRVNLTVRMA